MLWSLQAERRAQMAGGGGGGADGGGGGGAGGLDLYVWSDLASSSASPAWKNKRPWGRKRGRRER